MPSAVTNVTSPPLVDSTGRVITPSVSFEAVNYQEFIPLLIAVNKQQKQSIDSLRSQLAQLQSQINTCCAASNPPAEGAASGTSSNNTGVNSGNYIVG